MEVAKKNHQDFINEMESWKTKLEVINMIAVRSVALADLELVTYITM